jgi:membrane protein involved in colicin uptake
MFNRRHQPPPPEAVQNAANAARRARAADKAIRDQHRKARTEARRLAAQTRKALGR